MDYLEDRNGSFAEKAAMNHVMVDRYYNFDQNTAALFARFQGLVGDRIFSSSEGRT